MITSIAPKILENKGHLLENMMFTHLRRHTDQIYYYRTKKGKEIDFIWIDNRGKKHLMQITFSLKDPVTRKREISSLLSAIKELNLQEATIITYNEEEHIKVETGVIKIIPAWKYML